MGFGVHRFGGPYFGQGYAIITVSPIQPAGDLVEVSVTFHRTMDAAIAYATEKYLTATFAPGVHVETER